MRGKTDFFISFLLQDIKQFALLRTIDNIKNIRSTNFRSVRGRVNSLGLRVHPFASIFFDRMIGLTNLHIWSKIHTITMAEVAVLMSNARFGNCRCGKGFTAEGCVCANGRILGLHRICAELSPEKVEC